MTVTLINRLPPLRQKAQSLTIFRKLLTDPAVKGMLALADVENQCVDEAVSAYASFAASLFPHSLNWSEYLLNLVLEDENFYMLKRSQGEDPGEELESCLKEELGILEELSRIQPEEISREIGFDGRLPRWQTSQIDFYAVYKQRMNEIHAHGYGIFAKYAAFVVEDGELVPVKNPDGVRLSQLAGYERERKELIDNTLALLKGLPAANALLYGDAGTGKSTTVKAVANEFKGNGLRLIELKKRQLHQIPKLVDYLSRNPLKFILFIDDLSFTKDDDDFAALKAILEGSVSARADNLVVYATSNRRHLVKEKFSDRDGDEVHQNDTMEELISLSDRFGLTITFIKPGKDGYLSIVRELANQYGLRLSFGEVDAAAERFALSRGGRSPRVAKQCVEHLKAMEA